MTAPPQTPILDDSAISASDPVKIARIASKRRGPCDECIATMHANPGTGFWPQRAYMEIKAPALTVRVCAQHAEIWKRATGARRPRTKDQIPGQLGLRVS